MRGGIAFHDGSIRNLSAPLASDVVSQLALAAVVAAFGTGVSPVLNGSLGPPHQLADDIIDSQSFAHKQESRQW